MCVDMSTSIASGAPLPDEGALPFHIPALQVRGRLVRLGPAFDTLVSRHAYPPPVASLLGETLALAAALAASIKYDGIFTLQIRGDGPVRLIVCDVTSDGAVRGYVQYDTDALASTLRRLGTPEGALPDNPVPHLLGGGTLVFTVDQGPETDRYQGVVELDGATLADCAHAYFRQSEQLKTGIKLAAARAAEDEAPWRAAALLIQRLPGAHTPDGYDAADEEGDDDDWRRAVVLMSSATEREMLDPALPPEDLAWRLFHEDGVRGMARRPLHFGCRCSRERVERILRAIPMSELSDLRDDSGEVVVTCEFCGTTHRFDEAALQALHAQPQRDDGQQRNDEHGQDGRADEPAPAVDDPRQAES